MRVSIRKTSVRPVGMRWDLCARQSGSDGTPGVTATAVEWVHVLNIKIDSVRPSDLFIRAHVRDAHVGRNGVYFPVIFRVSSDNGEPLVRCTKVGEN